MQIPDPRTAHHLCALLLMVAVFSTGCTTSLTNMAPAQTLDAGEGQATLGYQFDVHTQSFTGVYRAGQSAVDQVRGPSEDDAISEETLRTLLDAALLWRLFPLGGTPEFMGRIGLYDDLLEGVDAGFRFNGNVFKGDLRLQLWSSNDDAASISAQFGYGHHRSIVATLVEWIALTQWKRKDFDFQINMGYELGEWAKLYASPRYILSRVSTEARLSDFLRQRLPERYQDWDPGQYFPASNMHYVGLNWGAMFGYRYAFINLDVSTFRVIYNPMVLDSRRDYSGWVFAPTVGFSVLWY